MTKSIFRHGVTGREEGGGGCCALVVVWIVIVSVDMPDAATGVHG
jgi:hypothetical protein